MSSPPRILAARGLLLAAVLVGGPGCTALPELDLNPLLRVERTVDGAVEIEALGPFIAYRNGPEGVSHALRPLYQHKANFGTSVTDWLAPFGRTFTTRSGSRFRFWPLIWSGETRDSPVGTEWDLVVFPIIFAGTGPREGDGYFAVWPLGGRIKNVFGLETFDFFLWPLFMRTRQDVTEEATHWTVLFFGGWTDGGMRDESFRVLPFYRHRLVRAPDGTLRTDQHTVLWPFFTWGLDEGDTPHPSWRWTFWPLVSRETSDTWSKTTLLWPFFRFNSETPVDPDEPGDYLYDLPWPLVRWRRDELKSVERVFPFYSHQNVRQGQLDSTNILLLSWYRVHRGRSSELGFPPRDYVRTDYNLVPLWHHSTRTVSGREGVDRQYQAWPFWHAEWDASGRTDDAAPSLLPLRNWEFLRPVDELFSPFWTLWRHRSDGTRHETRLLFDTILHRTGPEGVRISVPFLYSRRPVERGVHHHQVLWGLFGWTIGDEEGWMSVDVAGFEL